MFDVREHLDELRCRDTDWLHARRRQIVRERRRLHVEELAITAVLDERRAIEEKTIVRDGVSVHAARETVETARRLGSLPAIAAAAAAGRLSGEQLALVVQLADPSADAEWAERAPSMTVAELARRVRTLEKPTTADSRARREARHLRMWWSDDKGMLHLRGALADVDGSTFERTITALAEKMRPAKRGAWDTREHRAADALVELCDHATRTAGGRASEASLAPRPLFVVDVPLAGPATVAGVPIADSLVEQWRAHADLEPRLVDDQGRTVELGRKTAAVSPKLLRALLLRDGACRICGLRHGLQAHHLRPRSWGGADAEENMAMVCSRGAGACHRVLVPHGPWALVGDPREPGGLRMVHLDDLTDAEADEIGVPEELRHRRGRRGPPRAGPEAA